MNTENTFEIVNPGSIDVNYTMHFSDTDLMTTYYFENKVEPIYITTVQRENIYLVAEKCWGSNDSLRLTGIAFKDKKTCENWVDGLNREGSVGAHYFVKQVELRL